MISRSTSASTRLRVIGRRPVRGAPDVRAAIPDWAYRFRQMPTVRRERFKRCAMALFSRPSAAASTIAQRVLICPFVSGEDIRAFRALRSCSVRITGLAILIAGTLVRCMAGCSSRHVAQGLHAGIRYGHRALHGINEVGSCGCLPVRRIRRSETTKRRQGFRKKWLPFPEIFPHEPIKRAEAGKTCILTTVFGGNLLLPFTAGTAARRGPHATCDARGLRQSAGRWRGRCWRRFG